MIDYADIINSSFEFLGGFVVLLNCIELYKHKTVKGVSLASSVFFIVWGLWNLFYYPHLDQWISFWGGVFLTFVSTVWIVMALVYRIDEHNEFVLFNTKATIVTKGFTNWYRQIMSHTGCKHSEYEKWYDYYEDGLTPIEAIAKNEEEFLK